MAIRIAAGALIGLAAAGIFSFIWRLLTAKSANRPSAPLICLMGTIVGALVGLFLALPTSMAADRAADTADHPHPHVIQTQEEFGRLVLDADKPVLVDFFATWCGPCQELAPVIASLAKEYQGRAQVYEVDVDESRDIAGKYEIEFLPTVIVFYRGKAGEPIVGLKDASKYRRALDEHVGKDTAMQERTGLVTMKGEPLTLLGPALKVGDKAPEFVAVANDLSEMRLSDYAGKIRVISAVPSLDTPVCDTETRRFNEIATGLGDDVLVLTISMDLPFAQKRWCGAAGVHNVITLSDYRDADFGKSYGVLIKELRLLSRSVFVVDAEGRIAHIQLVRELTEQPDYDAAVETVRRLKAASDR